MLARARDWHSTAVAAVSGMLGFAAYPPPLAAALTGWAWARRLAEAAVQPPPAVRLALPGRVADFEAGPPLDFAREGPLSISVDGSTVHVRADAALAGATHLVVGRPILRAADPAGALRRLTEAAAVAPTPAGEA